jgi:lipopolysaccharide export system protein LptA
MIKFFNICCIVSVITCLPISIYGEDNLLYVDADTTKGRVIDGENVEILIGNVHAYQDTIHMYCDRAWRYREQQRMELFSNVIIDDGHHILRADKIIYYEPERRANCYTRVRMSGKSDSLYAEKFVYYLREKKAEASENVYLLDKENNASVWGDYGFYNSSEKQGDVYENAKFRHFGEGEDDTLYITSGKMHYQGAEPKRATAADSVIIQKGNFYASCDTAYYLISEEKIFLRGNPEAWQDDNEMIGDSIDVELDSLEFKDIYLKENASVKTLADSVLQKYNLLRGKTIQVTLAEKKPQSVIARKNASSLYLIENDGKAEGTNSAIADSILLIFTEGEMDSIVILGGVEGTFYPIDYEGEIESEY